MCYTYVVRSAIPAHQKDFFGGKQMKRIVSLLLVAVLLTGCVLALASCSGPRGTYKDALTGLTTLEFKGGKVTISIGNYSTTANFEMGEDEDGDTTITFTYDEGEKEQSGFKGTVSYSEGEEDGTKYIKIAGIRYNKVK